MATKPKDEKKPVEEELSEEDKQLKDELNLYVERLQEPKTDLHASALEGLKNAIRTATSSMTSVPKPLKFLKEHFPTLKTVYESMAAGKIKMALADVLSFLSMTYSQGESLKYRLVGSSEPVSSWGHEYVRHLSAEIIEEYNKTAEDADTSHLTKLALDIVPFFLKHNADPDACDLLLELEMLDKLIDFVDADSYARVCLYIVSCIPYVTPPDDIAILKTAHAIYRKVNQLPDALQLAIRLRDAELIQQDMNACTEPALKKQLAFMLGRSLLSFETEDEELVEILGNTKLGEYYLQLARDLDVVEPKTPEDIYKRHLENVKTMVKGDTAKQNLAASFVNGFVNAGFAADKLFDDTWLYKNKDHGMTSATASLGLIHLWHVEGGAGVLDKYTYSEDDHVKAGALLGLGVLCTNVKHESDPALAILSEHVNSAKVTLRICSILGLGIAYAGTAREEVLELLLPIVSDTTLTMELCSVAALALGHVFVGSCHGDIVSTILQTLMERDPADLKQAYARFMGQGLALLFVGKQDACDVTLETLKAIEGTQFIQVLVQICAFAGTGNVLKVQQMLHYCNDHLDEKDDATYQTFATIGVALIAMGEEIGSEMAMRTFNHLMHYGEASVRRGVPLAIGLLNTSNPQVNVLDILSKYSHDHDQDVAFNAIFAMGLVGAGTNNARLAQMLRQLATYYYKEPQALFLVRLAQGLVHMGKGTLTLNPFHANRSLMSHNAVASLLTVALAFTDSKSTILGAGHYLLFFLASAMYPRFLMALDEELKPVPVTVRVGQAVDTVGQAGKPKTITGFQTHSTPVLLGYSERAELGTEEFIALSKTLEGFVILRKNPDYVQDTDMQK